MKRSFSIFAIVPILFAMLICTTSIGCKVKPPADGIIDKTPPVISQWYIENLSSGEKINLTGGGTVRLVKGDKYRIFCSVRDEQGLTRLRMYSDPMAGWCFNVVNNDIVQGKPPIAQFTEDDQLFKPDSKGLIPTLGLSGREFVAGYESCEFTIVPVTVTAYNASQYLTQWTCSLQIVKR